MSEKFCLSISLTAGLFLYFGLMFSDITNPFAAMCFGVSLAASLFVLCLPLSFIVDCLDKEKDDEVKGEGVQYDYGFRIYDSRMAKFLSVDPLTASYPWYTPYQFAGNKPIKFIDLDGLEEAIYPNYYGRGGVLVKWSEKKYTYSVPFSNNKQANYISEDGKEFQLIR